MMNWVPAGALIAYDADTGLKLFIETNRATRLPDQSSALPAQGQLYVHGGVNYRIVGVRKTSTETQYEVDVREEPSEQAESNGPGGPVG